MWRRLTAMLFLIVLAQSANALSNADLDTSNAHKISISLNELSSSTSADTDSSEELFNLPRTFAPSSSLFSNEAQTSPNYVLEIAFFEEKLCAALYKHLANPPLQVTWFEQLGHRTNSSRLSGWKDSNLLYSSRKTYHS